MERIEKVNPVYGEAWATAGHFFVINRRYEEGIRCYRKAVELDPTLWEARSELGVNLMRLGEEGEARQHLEKVFNDGPSTRAGTEHAAADGQLQELRDVQDPDDASEAA